MIPVTLKLKVAPPKDGVTDGKSTRQPQNYDLHLPADRRLKEVHWAPNLIQELQDSLHTVHPPEKEILSSKRFWDTTVSYLVDQMGNLDEISGVKGGETEIASLFSPIIALVAKIASLILFHMSQHESYPKLGHYDLQCKPNDGGPPHLDNVIEGTEERVDLEVLKMMKRVLLNMILVGYELKSLTAADGTFIYRLVARAATSSGFNYQTCTSGVECSHWKFKNRIPSISATVNDGSDDFYKRLTAPRPFNPSSNELNILLRDPRVLLDNVGDERPVLPFPTIIPPSQSLQDATTVLENYPRVKVALEILRTGAYPLKDDVCSRDAAAKKYTSMPENPAELPRRSTRPKPEKRTAATLPVDCKKYSWENKDGSFNQHFTYVLQQVQ